MALVHGRDYLLVPKTTHLGDSGVVEGFLVAFPEELFLLPKSAIGGQGRTIVRTSFSLDGRPVLQAVTELLQASDTTAEQAREVLVALVEGKGDAVRVDIPGLKALRVKTGWFSRGVYFKKPEHSGWRAFPIGDKALSEQFLAFYASQLRE